MTQPPSGAVAAAARESYGRIVATLIRVTGDWEMAEDCAQEALAAALEKWPATGVPANPGGWLMTVARNRAIDMLRRITVEQRKLREIAALTPAEVAPAEGKDDVEDDRLRLIFTCCHPALALEARVALTLRTVCGVPTAEIGQAFLTGESTMTRRLTRAKTKIAKAGIPYRVPSGPALHERLPGVLAVVYLLFTQGYNADGDAAFADEAIRLARLLRRLMPDQPEVAGLLALCLFQHSRRDARKDTDGNLLTLDKQDRTRWDHAAIAEARALLPELRPGPYAIQAQIAAEHVTEETDWPAVARWYDLLFELQPSPVVQLNRAVAHGFASGPEAGLAILSAVRRDGVLDRYAPAAAAEAELTARMGDRVKAELLFREAAGLTNSPAERRALLDRADQMLEET
ncbi:sigma-70 family RNA polymerase sigma factor [Actinoplanes sp. NPDC051633]|uniref:RNA polymerase sigma factor n=1 Tax=Actinoplanes sp. NPDC051633 TaxID=3155670 RepID=UPI003447EDF3